MWFPGSRRAMALVAIVLATAIGGGAAAAITVGEIGDGRDADIVYVHDGDRAGDGDSYDDCDGFRDEDDDC